MFKFVLFLALLNSDGYVQDIRVTGFEDRVSCETQKEKDEATVLPSELKGFTVKGYCLEPGDNKGTRI
jgi:hypothetical protein